MQIVMHYYYIYNALHTWCNSIALMELWYTKSDHKGVELAQHDVICAARTQNYYIKIYSKADVMIKLRLMTLH